MVAFNFFEITGKNTSTSFKYSIFDDNDDFPDDWNENISSGYKKFYEIVVEGILKQH